MGNQTSHSVVLVDDDPIVRMDLKQRLQEEGYEVIAEGSDGFDAVELCEAHHPDMVILDLKLPVFDGFGAARTIKEEKLAECLIVCTAYEDSAFLDQADELGIMGYLPKPVNQRLLRPTLEIAWAQVRRARELEERILSANEELKNAKYIEKAKGILAKKNHISETDAYNLIRSTAMKKRVKVSEIAERIVQQEKRIQKSRERE